MIMTIMLFTICTLIIVMLVIVLTMIIQVKNVMTELKQLKVIIYESYNVSNYVKDSVKFLDDHFVKLNVVYSAITNFKDEVRKMIDANRDIKTLIRSYDRNQLENNIRLNDTLNDIAKAITKEDDITNRIKDCDRLKCEDIIANNVSKDCVIDDV